MSNISFNPGVGLKLTSPRISNLVRPSSSETPSPDYYSVKCGMMDLTERQKNENERLSKRYERKSIGSSLNTLSPSRAVSHPDSLPGISICRKSGSTRRIFG